MENKDMNNRPNERPFFSIVMPVYNGQKYIKTMIESIRRQSVTDWELLVVDDCSTDQSRKIVAELAEKDGRIRLIAMERNAGVSHARNLGIREAKGNYLWLADADDLVEENLLEKVQNSLRENPAKLVIFGLIEEYYDAQNVYAYSHIVAHEEKRFKSKEELRPEMIRLEQETLYGYPWNKVYDLDYLKSLSLEFQDYQDAKFIEDIAFNIVYCMEIDSLNILSCTPYHYAKRLQGNLTNEFVKDYFKFHKKRIQMLYDQYEAWDMLDLGVKEILGSLYARYILSALQQNCDPKANMSHRQRKNFCKALFAQKLYRNLIPCAQAKDSKALQIVLAALRLNKAGVCLLMGRAVYVIRKKLPMLYSKVKSGR